MANVKTAIWLFSVDINNNVEFSHAGQRHWSYSGCERVAWLPVCAPAGALERFPNAYYFNVPWFAGNFVGRKTENFNSFLNSSALILADLQQL